MKLFFEVKAINTRGVFVTASIAIDALRNAMISDFSKDDISGKAPIEFVEGVHSILLVGSMSLYCCEDRPALVARIENWSQKVAI